jgi:hypothetical protein
MVQAPSTEITLQDLHDTLTSLEDEPAGMSYEQIIRSTGKDSLGGGVYVGITSTLLNAKLGFQSRKEWFHEGVVTADDLTGRRLIDALATFVTDGVEPGFHVINFTDATMATILRVVSETELETDILGGGIGNHFDVGDAYKIRKVVQCSVAGGNLVALDALGDSMSSILSTVGTQVVRTSSASATLQELADIQYSSFGGGVTFDATSVYSGSAYPVGTPRQPVNNTTDMLVILAERGFRKVFVIRDMTLDSGSNYSGLTFVEGAEGAEVTVTSAANVAGCTFDDMEIGGVLDGGAQIENCEISKLDYVDGMLIGCELEPPLFTDTYTIRLNGVRTAYLIDCFGGATTHAGEVRHPYPIVDMGGTGAELAVRGYRGDLKIINKSGPEPVTVDLDSGTVHLDTITGGTITVRGVGAVLGTVGGTAVLDTTDLVNPATVSNAVWDEVLAGHSGAGSAGKTLTDVSAAAGLTPTQATMLLEMYKILGLDPTKPLVMDVPGGTRKVPSDGSEISQTAVEGPPGVVTLTRV